MAGNQSTAAFSAVKKSFNVLKEWRDMRENQDSFYSDKDEEIRRIKRQQEEDQGVNITKAGASGIDLSSFNDALLSKDLENARKIHDERKKMQEELLALKQQAKNERKNRRNRVFSYSVGLLSDLSRFGF